MKEHKLSAFLAIVIAVIFGMGAYYNLTETFPGAETSGVLTGSNQVTTVPAWITHLQAYQDGAAVTETVTVYDTNSGVTSGATIIAKLTLNGTNDQPERTWPIPVRLTKGLYVDASGATVYAIVDYTQR